MTRPRNAAAVSLAALLAIGATTALAAGPAAAQTDRSTSTSTVDPSPVVPEPGQPTDLALTLPGLGDVNLTFDPTSGQIVTLTVTPLEGVTAADPVPVHNGVLLEFALSDGSVRAVVIEIDDDGIEVEVEHMGDPGDHRGDGNNDELHSGPPPVAERGRSAEHRNDDNEHSQGRHNGTSTTIDRSGPSTGSGDDRSGDRDDDTDATESDSGRRSGD
ncbi:MAG: hypothetical protein FGM58_08950 [Acidimicrobiia bacterium]|nr:hypothetical protein [Acidimicrobiia bacterium]